MLRARPLTLPGLALAVAAATLLVPVAPVEAQGNCPAQNGLPSTARCFFVDQNAAGAADTNNGLSETYTGGNDGPWQTLGPAVCADPTCTNASVVVAGDTVLVKDGTYAPPTGRNSFRTRNVGASESARVAIRAFTRPDGSRHRPTLSRGGLFPDNQTDNNPVVVVNGQLVTWDGFTLAPGTMVSIYGGRDIVLENIRIDSTTMPSPCVPGNYSGVFVQASQRVIVRNSVIRGIHYQPPNPSLGQTDCNPDNAGAVVLFDVDALHFHNNEIADTFVGINNKRNVTNAVEERNYIHNLDGAAVTFTGFQCVVDGGATDCPVRNNVVRNNVVFDVQALVTMNLLPWQPGHPRSDPLRGTAGCCLQFYNNTVIDARQSGLRLSQFPGTEVYDNLIHTTGAAPQYVFGTPVTGNPVAGVPGFPGIPADLVSDFNDFTAGTTVQWRPDENVGSFTVGLPEWQTATVKDADSLSTVPEFAGPTTGATVPVTNFRLAVSSPLRNAGRTRAAGAFTSTTVHIGAYSDDTIVIGPADATAPSPPRNVTIH